MRGVGQVKGRVVVCNDRCGYVGTCELLICLSICYVCSIKEPPIIFGPDLLYTVTILIL